MSAFDSLNALAAVATKTKKADKVERPVVDCPAAVHKPFYRFIGAKAIAEIVESRVEVEKAAVCEVMLDAYTETLFNTRCQPQNPAIALDKDGRPDCKGIFQVKQQYKFNLKEGNEEVKERMVASLCEAGMDKGRAENLVKNEVDCTPETALRPFNELVEGHYVDKQFVAASADEKAVAEKLIAFVLGKPSSPLTPAERDLVLVKRDRIKVKDGFLERVVVYCTTIAELKAVFKVIVPTNFVSHTKFAISDTPEAKNQRMLDEFKLMVTELEIEG